ncbi:MAG: winged helix-turn-helix domain-containing protein [Clostridium sp.]
MKKEEKPGSRVISAGDLKLDTDSRRVFIADREINLTAKEFDLLELFVCHPNRSTAARSFWAMSGEIKRRGGDVRTVDVHVRRLREKIEPSPSDPKYVHTKWGVGYYFRA